MGIYSFYISAVNPHTGRVTFTSPNDQRLKVFTTKITQITGAGSVVPLFLGKGGHLLHHRTACESHLFSLPGPVDGGWFSNGKEKRPTLRIMGSQN